jgi:hypothetical protein
LNLAKAVSGIRKKETAWACNKDFVFALGILIDQFEGIFPQLKVTQSWFSFLRPGTRQSRFMIDKITLVLFTRSNLGLSKDKPGLGGTKYSRIAVMVNKFWLWEDT